jgi:hypothetical protein
MLISLRPLPPAVLLAGILAGISAAACSTERERPRAVEIATSDSRGPAMTDTAGTPADTPRVAPDDSSIRAPAAKRPSIPRPSIDPGRKNPKPLNIPKPAGNPQAPAAPAAANEPAAPAPAGNEWLKYDAATNTVTFELIAGVFSFNGYTSGGATLIVPSKANIVMNFVNKDGTPHSAQIISGEGPLPNAAVDAAIPRAYTNKLLEGLPQEGSDVMRFPVPESGNYRIFCGVPGHGLSGMWIWMRVDPSAKTPSFGPTKA